MSAVPLKALCPPCAKTRKVFAAVMLIGILILILIVTAAVLYIVMR